MVHSCPVCGLRQADRVHLADHLALRAVLHADDHEGWLDEHVDGWRSKSPEAVGAVVAEHATETDDGTPGDEPVEPEAPTGAPNVDPDWARDLDPRSLDPEARRAIEAAIEMTREHRRDGAADREE